jgi:methylmalonyl-CoA mutase N-terminal domain/subunit
MDPEGYSRQISRLKQLRDNRDSAYVGQTLDRLRRACLGTENTMPYIIDAVKAYATLGEIISVMKEVFGIYRESPGI